MIITNYLLAVVQGVIEVHYILVFIKMSSLGIID